MHPPYMHLVLFLAGGVAVSGVGAINNPAAKQLNTCTINTNVCNKYSSPINIKTQNPYTCNILFL